MRFDMRDKKVYQQWERWFAWYPIETSTNIFVWLEFVERYRTILDGYILYRTID